MSSPVRGLGALVLVVVCGGLLDRCAAVAPAEIRTEGYDCGYTGDARNLTWDVTPRPGAVPPGFDPVEAVWCRTPRTSADGVDAVFSVTEKRSTAVEPLIERFSQPDDEGVGDCAALHVLDSIPARVWLLDADGRAVLGHSPAGICGPLDIGLEEAFHAEG